MCRIFVVFTRYKILLTDKPSRIYYNYSILIVSLDTNNDTDTILSDSAYRTHVLIYHNMLFFIYIINMINEHNHNVNLRHYLYFIL